MLHERLTRDEPVDRLALALATWGRYLGGQSDDGRPHAIEDPQAVALRALGRDLRASTDDGLAALLLLDQVSAWTSLPDAPSLAAPLARIWGVWRLQGPVAALRRAVTT